MPRDVLYNVLITTRLFFMGTTVVAPGVPFVLFSCFFSRFPVRFVRGMGLAFSPRLLSPLRLASSLFYRTEVCYTLPWIKTILSSLSSTSTGVQGSPPPKQSTTDY